MARLEVVLAIWVVLPITVLTYTTVLVIELLFSASFQPFPTKRNPKPVVSHSPVEGLDGRRQSKIERVNLMKWMKIPMYKSHGTVGWNISLVLLERAVLLPDIVANKMSGTCYKIMELNHCDIGDF